MLNGETDFRKHNALLQKECNGVLNYAFCVIIIFLCVYQIRMVLT